MTYSLSPQPYPQWSTGLLGFGALGAAPVTEECRAWITKNYNVAEYERIRTQVLPQLLREMPGPGGVDPGAFGSGPLPWSLFELSEDRGVPDPSRVDPNRPVVIHRRGASGFLGLGAGTISSGASRADLGRIASRSRQYKMWLDRVAVWLEKCATTFTEMAAALNLPPFWLVPSDPGSARIGSTLFPEVTRAEPPLPSVDSYGFVRQSNKEAGLLALRHFKAPLALEHKRHLAFDPVGVKAPLAHAWMSGKKLTDFWYKFMFLGEPDSYYYYNLGEHPDRIPPVAWVGKDHGSTGSINGAGSESSLSCAVFAGPVIHLQHARNLIQLFQRRSAVEVLSNAYLSWAAILNVWAASHPGPSSDRAAEVAAGFAMVGNGLMSAGAVGVASGAGALVGVVAGAVGMGVTLLGKAMALLTDDGRACGEDKRGDNRRRVAWSGLFCGPPVPLLRGPPANCSAADALKDIREKEKAKGDKSLWEQLRPYLTHPAFIGAVGLIAAFGAYRVFAPKTANRRRYRMRNARKIKLATTAQLEALKAQAIKAGDKRVASLCNQALSYARDPDPTSKRALIECSQIIDVLGSWI